MSETSLLDRILSVPPRDRDQWVDAEFGFPSPPPDEPNLPRGAVFYLPAGVEEILAMVREVPLGPSDVLVDLGSGLGRVVILAHLLSGARALGVEIQASLVRLARERAAALGIAENAVSFLHADAAATELDGSVFFLYAPFNGPLLTAVLGRVESVARRRRIVVCTVGLELRDVAWLVPRTTPNLAFCLYDSRP
jgi:SAM-dependent methyltransferase